MTESPTNLAESRQILWLPLDPLRYYESGQLTFALCQTPRLVGLAPCWTVTDGVIGLVVGPNYLHDVCIAFCSHLPRKLLLPLCPFPPKRHNIMSGHHTDTRTRHNRCHVLTQNSIMFNQSTSALSKYDPFVGSFGMITVCVTAMLTSHLIMLHSHASLPQSTMLIVKSW